MIKKTCYLFVLLLFSFPLHAQDYRLEKLASGLGIVWGMAFISDSQIMVTQRSGEIAVLDVGSRDIRRLQGGPRVLDEGQGGLLDVAVPPDFKPGGWIYFTYSKENRGQGATTLARARLKGDQLVEWKDLLVTKSASGSGQHYGSRVAFDDQGYLFFGIGDRGKRPNSQNLLNHAGAILRLHRDGRVPADNPFINRSSALPEIWSYGHRNPQGLVWDDEHKRLWEIEHGPRGGDEINLIQPGLNYGWPVISYGKEYWGPMDVGEGTHKPGMEQPVKYYVPSIAPSSLMVYRGEAFPDWKGALMSGALKLRHLNVVYLDESGQPTGEDRLLEDLGERIRSLAQDNQGLIYFATDSGNIYRMKPTT